MEKFRGVLPVCNAKSELEVIIKNKKKTNESEELGFILVFGGFVGWWGEQGSRMLVFWRSVTLLMGRISTKTHGNEKKKNVASFSSFLGVFLSQRGEWDCWGRTKRVGGL